jgi:SAM-dependent methyltransferase
MSKKISLDVGCGHNKRGDIGIDIYNFEGVTVVADISNGLPFKDNVFAKVFFYHVIEHIPIAKFDTVFYELWRVTKANGLVKIKTPHYSGPICWHDPTHVRPYAMTTFTRYLTSKDKMHFNYNQRYAYDLENARLNWHGFPEDAQTKSRSFLFARAVEFLANLNPFMQKWCEKLWCYWVGGFDEIDATLKVMKNNFS